MHINSDIKEMKNLIPWLLKSASDNIVEKLKEVVSEYRKRRKFRGVKLSWFFNYRSEVKFCGFHGIV